MPRPVEALPWGSRSTVSTCSPVAASAVPRLIAVVVLPTPPFWLAIASTRGGFPVAGRLARVTTSAASAGAAWGRSVMRASSVIRDGKLGHGRRGLHACDHDDACMGVGSAWDQLKTLDFPIFRCLRQF